MKQIRNRCSAQKWFLPSLLVLCLISIPGFLQARELGEHQVRSAVQTWVRYVTADARPDAVIEAMEPHQVEGETVAYIAHLSGGGFCLCGADDLVVPVYLYCPRGTYDPRIPDYEYILWEIESRLKYLRDGLEKGDPDVVQYQNVLSKRASYWQDLIAGRVPRKTEEPKGPLVEPDSMSLGLTCQWHQSSPYNDSCPELTPGVDENVRVGCVATAMSQIMYYWKWPNTGSGTLRVPYTYHYIYRNDWDEEPLANDPGIPAQFPWIGRLQWTPADGGKLRMNGYWDAIVEGDALDISEEQDYRDALFNLWSRLTRDSTDIDVNFGATTYDWSILEDIHDSTGIPDAGDAEVAQLCYHAGASVYTSYGLTLSTAYRDRVEGALEYYFRYDQDATFNARDQDHMKGEIQWLRPLVLFGRRPEGGVGHGWVVYGYNTNTDPWQFLMNMGWGWVDSWYACDSVPRDFNSDQDHVTHIAPENVMKFVGGGVYGDGSPANPYEHIEEAIVEAQDGATLIFKAGSVNEFDAATLVIDRPFTLKGREVVIR